MSEYGWSQLSQWDTPPSDAYIRHVPVKTGLSETVCRFMLVNRVDQCDGYMRSEYVKACDVTESVLEAAGPVWEASLKGGRRRHNEIK